MTFPKVTRIVPVWSLKDDLYDEMIHRQSPMMVLSNQLSRPLSRHEGASRVYPLPSRREHAETTF